MSTMQLDLSVLLIVVLVWGLYFVLKKFFFDPINQTLTARHAAIEGTQLEAKERLAEVEKQSKVYGQAIKEAKLESYRKQEAFRAEAMKERTLMIAGSRRDAEQLISLARQEISSQAAEAKRVLESEVTDIADEIVKSVLQ